jgi:hypothetical protein
MATIVADKREMAVDDDWTDIRSSSKFGSTTDNSAVWPRYGDTQQDLKPDY